MIAQEKERPRSSLNAKQHVADLSGACLEAAVLRRANLAGAILRNVNMRGGDLQGANLRKASLYRANLKGADLGGANLGMADLRFACLEDADLRRVNLCQANLLGARLAGAKLKHSDITGATLPDGTLFSDDESLTRFTDNEHQSFSPTLAAIDALEIKNSDAWEPAVASPGLRQLQWHEFVERTYGSLADDPIQWQPAAQPEIEDTNE